MLTHRRKSRARRVTMTLGACALAVALSAAVASAKHHHHAVQPSFPVTSKGFTLSDGSSPPEAASCPRHTSIAGGGARMASPDTNSDISQLGPVGHSQFAVTFYSDGGGGATVYAICAKHLKIQKVSKTAPVPTGSTGAIATARCPHGTSVIDGGVTLSSTFAYIGTSAPAGKHAWTGFAFTSSAGESETVTALCAKGLKTTIRTAVAQLPLDSFHSATARCPKHSKVIGGGFAMSDGFDDYPSASYPSGKRAWTVTGRHSVASPTTSVTAAAICLA